MQRSTPRSVAILASLSVAALALPPIAEAFGAAQAEGGSLAREPVLVYVVAGSGPPESAATLIVYSDGRTVYAQTGFEPFGLPDEVLAGFVPVSEVQSLVAGLVGQGAFRLPDAVANQLSVATLTLLRPANDVPAHTFSYSLFPFAAYLGVENAVQSFLDEVVFPTLVN